MHRLVGKVRDRIATLERQRDDLEATLQELTEIEQAAQAHLNAKAGDCRFADRKSRPSRRPKSHPVGGLKDA